MFSRLAKVQAEQFTNYQMRLLRNTNFNHNFQFQNVLKNSFYGHNSFYPLEERTSRIDNSYLHPKQNNFRPENYIKSGSLTNLNATSSDSDAPLISTSRNGTLDASNKYFKQEEKDSRCLDKNDDVTL